MNNILILKANFIKAKRNAELLAEPLKTAKEDLAAIQDAAHRRWMEANAELIDSAMEADDLRNKTEESLREALKLHYEETGEKQFDSDLSVRVLTKLEYETDKANKWARKEAPFLLVVSAKQFEKLAVAPTLDFVEVVESVSAVVSKSL